MTDSFVTQCPHCQTSFRVSHTQLSVARGVVRCGSCLQVFNAARQLLEQRAGKDSSEPTALEAVPAAPVVAPLAAEPAAEAAAEPAQIADAEPEPEPEPEQPAAVEPSDEPAPRAISQKQWSASELDLDHLDLDEELARLEQREIQPTSELVLERSKPDNLSARRDSSPDEEAQWSDSLFSAPAEERIEAEQPLEPPELDDEPPAAKAAEKKAEVAKPLRTEPTMSFTLVDLDDEPRPPRLRLERSELDEPDEAPSRERLSASDDEDDIQPLLTAPASRQRERSEPGVHDDSLLDLEDEPLHLEWQRRRRTPWGKRILWFILVLLTAGALLGQYVWYHFDELARQDQYRPWFQQLCPSLGCKVPSKVDIKRIKSSNLVVRSHPDFNGALVVDAILYNRAPFSQPFPLLELRFADLNGHLIASRRFKPGEYLGGDLLGQSEMPPQTPIHVALDILDPGVKAVNYSLSFHSPE